MPTRKSLSSAIEHAHRTHDQPHQPLSAASVEVQTEALNNFDSTSIQTEPLLCLTGPDLANKIQFEREGACLALIRRICETIENFRFGHLLAVNELSQANSMDIGEKNGNLSNESPLERSERAKHDLDTGHAVVSTSPPLRTNTSDLHSTERSSAVLPSAYSRRVTSARAATRQRCSAHPTGLTLVNGVAPSPPAYDSVATPRHSRPVALPAAGSVRSTYDPGTVESRRDTRSLDHQQRSTAFDAVDTQVNLFVGAVQCVRFHCSPLRIESAKHLPPSDLHRMSR